MLMSWVVIGSSLSPKLETIKMYLLLIYRKVSCPKSLTCNVRTSRQRSCKKGVCQHFLDGNWREDQIIYHCPIPLSLFLFSIERYCSPSHGKNILQFSFNRSGGLNCSSQVFNILCKIFMKSFEETGLVIIFFLS